MSTVQVPRSLPRRANGIRQLAAQMANKKLTELTARQAVSDRVGYAVATAVGAVAYEYGGLRVVAIVLALYAASAALAYRRYRAIKR